MKILFYILAPSTRIAMSVLKAKKIRPSRAMIFSGENSLYLIQDDMRGINGDGSTLYVYEADKIANCNYIVTLAKLNRFKIDFIYEEDVYGNAAQE